MRLTSEQIFNTIMKRTWKKIILKPEMVLEDPYLYGQIWRREDRELLDDAYKFIYGQCMKISNFHTLTTNTPFRGEFTEKTLPIVKIFLRLWCTHFKEKIVKMLGFYDLDYPVEN